MVAEKACGTRAVRPRSKESVGDIVVDGWMDGERERSKRGSRRLMQEQEARKKVGNKCTCKELGEKEGVRET